LIIIFKALIIKRENGTYPWESIVTELFLVCDEASKVQTLFMIGILAEIFSIISKFFNIFKISLIFGSNSAKIDK